MRGCGPSSANQPDQVTSDLKRYLGRFQFATITRPRSAPPQRAPVAAAPADDLALALARASLLAWQSDPERAAEGRAGLDQLAAAAPDNLRVAEMTALVAYYTGDCSTARPRLARAVALGTTDASIRQASDLLNGVAPTMSAKMAGGPQLEILPCTANR